MGKIEFEDLTVRNTSEEQTEFNIVTLASGLIQVAGRSAILLGLTLRHATLSLFSAAEILLAIGGKSGKISADEFQGIRNKAIEYADKKLKILEKAGIIDMIESINTFRCEKDDE